MAPVTMSVTTIATISSISEKPLSCSVLMCSFSARVMRVLDAEGGELRA